MTTDAMKQIPAWRNYYSCITISNFKKSNKDSVIKF